jgi:hypothetical protein
MSKTEEIEIYKLCVEMADRTSERRMKNNSFLLTLNTAIISLAGYLSLNNNQYTWVIVLSISCIIINTYWFFLISSYKKINDAKYAVIQKIEQNLSIKAFEDEDRFLSKDKHRKLSDIEKLIPITLIILNVFIIIMISFFTTPQNHIEEKITINVIGHYL